SGLVPLPWGSTYASSKWAVLGFTESIRQEMAELGHKHVGVTTVCPGYVDTGMFDGVRPPLLMPFLKPEQLVEKVRTAILKRQEMVLEPYLVKLTPLLKGILPRFLSDGLADLMGVTTGMKSWSGHAEEPGD
ncbi:MAG: SDR family NAD(P)-dependent oxidoreductase, partial [Thermoanaerobaculia bacterium]